MLKFNPKKLIIHGTVIVAMIIACCIDFQLIILWNLGYGLFFMSRLVAKWTRDLHPLFVKVLTILLLVVGSVPCVMLMCIPSWIICVAHSINNPEYSIDLPSYNGRGVEIHNASFYRNYNSYLYEGKIDENSLKKVAVLKGWQFKEISKAVRIYDTAKTRIKEHLDKSYKPQIIVIENGLVYNGYSEGSDCGEYVVYDRKNKRLYFLSTLR